MTRRSQALITASFPGAKYPVGSKVRFTHDGKRIDGAVAELKRRYALVHTGQGHWDVPYNLLQLVERGRCGGCTLADVETLAHNLIKRHKANSGLANDWDFGFDLAPSRAGACKYGERRIDLSVSFCLAASRAEITDTILHEIAHAIVGKAHNHDPVWVAKAREIGCSGARTHTERHTPAKWVGECGCGKRWFRQRLSRRVAGQAHCPHCNGAVRWRRQNIESGVAED